MYLFYCEKCFFKKTNYVMSFGFFLFYFYFLKIFIICSVQVFYSVHFFILQPHTLYYFQSNQHLVEMPSNCKFCPLYKLPENEVQFSLLIDALFEITSRMKTHYNMCKFCNYFLITLITVLFECRKLKGRLDLSDLEALNQMSYIF